MTFLFDNLVKHLLKKRTRCITKSKEERLIMMYGTIEMPTHKNCNHCLSKDVAFKLSFAQFFAAIILTNGRK